MIIIKTKTTGLIISQSHSKSQSGLSPSLLFYLKKKKKEIEWKRKEKALSSRRFSGCSFRGQCESKKELKTGALCCVVASRPLVTTKSPAGDPRDISSLSQDDDDLQWRTNLSFSPAGYSRDCLEHGFALYSSTTRARTSLESPIWASNSSASSVPRSNSSKHQCFNEEKGFDRETTVRSLISLSETSSKQPFSTYPRVFCNPVSDCENPQLNHTQKDLSTNPGNHQGSPVEEANSNEMLLDVERLDETQLGTPRDEPPGSMIHQRCGVCKKLLSQKSPWCSHKMMRCGDKPAAGVFPCHHVYHVECLDQATTKTQTRDPPCPVCSNTNTMEQQLVVPETLQMALRSLRRSRTTVESETLRSSCNDNQRRHSSRRSRKWENLSCCLSLSGSSRTPT